MGMWEIVRANKNKSLVLACLMAVLLLALGFLIAEAIQQGAGYAGLAVAGGVWALMALISYFQGGRLLMASAGAKQITPDMHPQLFNVVEEMVIASGMKKTPDVYIIDSMDMNAFATGRDPEHAAVAVTAGLLARLNRDQLQGVIAHEISHIVNRDILFMTMLGVMLGAIVMASELFLRGMRFSALGPRRSRSSSQGGGQAQVIFAILALVMAIVAPIAAQIIYFAASRRREYLADASAVVLTRYPEGLASALEALGTAQRSPREYAGRATAPMFIVNPLAARGAVGLFSTHPPIEQRVRILRGLGGTGEVSYSAYEQAWSSAEGRKGALLPQTALASAAVPTRLSSDAESPGRRKQTREAYDSVRQAHGYRIVACGCGARMKLPPSTTDRTWACPRCGRPLQTG